MNRIAAAVLVAQSASLASPQDPEPPLGAVIYPPIPDTPSSPFTLAGNDRYVIVGNPANQTALREPTPVFDRLTGIELYELNPSGPVAPASYATAVALWEDLAFVAGRSDDPASLDGFVDVFDLTTGDRIDTLTGPPVEGNDWFGFKLDVAGDRLAVAAILTGYPGVDSGRIYVYSLPDLTLLYEITDTNTTDATFPLEMAMSEDFIVAISGLPEDIGNLDATFLVFDAATGATLAEANPVVEGETITRFSGDVAVSDRYALAADVSNDRAGDGAGEVYVFDLQQFAFVNALTPPTTRDTFQLMGLSMATRGSVAVISSPQFFFFNFEPGLIDIVSLPTGTVLRTIRGYERPDTDRFRDFGDFGRAVEFAAAGVLVSSNYPSDWEGRVDWIPLPEICPADTNRDGLLGLADFGAWIIAFTSSDPTCDQNRDGACTPNDFNAWLINFNAGC